MVVSFFMLIWAGFKVSVKDVLVTSLSFSCFGVVFVIVCVRFGYWCGILLWFAYGVRSFSISCHLKLFCQGFSICYRGECLFLAFWLI